jgi:Molybdopterin oxidoreductase Fe4S4 domain
MPKQVVHAACPHDCPDACGVLITVENGRATKIVGHPEHPVTRGFLCAKVAKYLDRVYSPDRVLDFFEPVFGAAGRYEPLADSLVRCEGPRHCRRRNGKGVQPSRRNPIESPSGRRGSAGSSRRDTELGQAGPRIPERQRTDLRKTSDLGNSATFYPVLVEVEKS